jgi:Fe-S cluster assembly protein SufD
VTTESPNEGALRHYVDGFQEQARLAAPPWLTAIRHRAIDRFAELGFPTAKQEEWRYTDISRIVRNAFAHADAPGPGGADALITALALPELGGDRLVFIDGHYCAEHSVRSSAEDELTLQNLAQLAANTTDIPTGPLAHYAKVASFEEEAFAALNTAWAEDGAVISIAKNRSPAQPLHLVFLSSAEESTPHVSQPRVLIIAEAGSEATVVQDHLSLAEGAAFTNTVCELVVRDNATLRLILLQRESAAASHIATQRATLARDSRLVLHTFNLSGALTRNDLSVCLAGEGAECDLLGLYLGADEQVIDNHTLVDHTAPHCSSRELYKGVLGDRARGVFRGRVLVRPGARGTDAQQQNRNLLLTRSAEADSKPQLEIYNDDVKCSHGSSIGQLDPEALFFLRSRGLDESRARALLIEGYVTELLDNLPSCTQQWIRELVLERLSQLLAGSEES